MQVNFYLIFLVTVTQIGPNVLQGSIFLEAFDTLWQNALDSNDRWDLNRRSLISEVTSLLNIWQ